MNWNILGKEEDPIDANNYFLGSSIFTYKELSMKWSHMGRDTRYSSMF